MLRFIAVFVFTVAIIGCNGAPVQEMSDARQAIAAARAAGATADSSDDLSAAQKAIARAEADLQAQHFTRARIAAREAKQRASAALVNAGQKTAIDVGAHP
jgi:Domain of unknown function (DUF4398)